MHKTNVKTGGDTSNPAGDQPDGTKTTDQGTGNEGTQGNDKGTQSAEDKYNNQKIRAEKAESDRDAALAKVAELEAASATGTAVIDEAEIAKFAEENDVDPAFAKGLLEKAVNASSSVIQKKLDAEFAKRDQASNAQRKNDLFDQTFDKAVAGYEGIPVNKEYVKSIQFANPEKTVAGIIEDLYGGMKKAEDKPKDSPEDISIGDVEGGKIDFENLSPAQIDKVLDDPALKEKYYAYLDTKA